MDHHGSPLLTTLPHFPPLSITNAVIVRQSSANMQLRTPFRGGERLGGSLADRPCRVVVDHGRVRRRPENRRSELSATPVIAISDAGWRKVGIFRRRRRSGGAKWETAAGIGNFWGQLPTNHPCARFSPARPGKTRTAGSGHTRTAQHPGFGCCAVSMCGGGGRATPARTASGIDLPSGRRNHRPCCVGRASCRSRGPWAYRNRRRCCHRPLRGRRSSGRLPWRCRP